MPDKLKTKPEASKITVDKIIKLKVEDYKNASVQQPIQVDGNNPLYRSFVPSPSQSPLGMSNRPQQESAMRIQNNSMPNESLPTTIYTDREKESVFNADRSVSPEMSRSLDIALVSILKTHISNPHKYELTHQGFLKKNMLKT